MNSVRAVRIPAASVTIMRSIRGAFLALPVVVCICLMLGCAAIPPVPSPSSASLTDEGIYQQRTVALLGASGMVGDYLLREALARGHVVRALARTPAKLDEFADQITIVQGDARNSAAIRKLLQGADIVINALGPVAADGDAARYINTDSTRIILREMQSEAISQYMVVSGAAVVMPGDQRDLLGLWIRTLAQIGLAGELKDKQAEYELLALSSVDWILVRCPLIDPQRFRSEPLVSLQTAPAFRVRAGELARFMLDQIDAQQFVREGPFIGSRQAM